MKKEILMVKLSILVQENKETRTVKDVILECQNTSSKSKIHIKL